MVIKNFAFLPHKMERFGKFLKSFKQQPLYNDIYNNKILWCILEFLFVTIQILSLYINYWMILTPIKGWVSLSTNFLVWT